MILDTKAQREHILFTIKHHGTRTQGEDYRLEQVADCIMEIIVQITDVLASSNHEHSEHGHIPHFYIK